MSKSGDVIVGLVTGFAAGIALGMLFAPDIGKKTRERLNERIAKGANQIRYTADEFLEDNGLVAELATTLRDKLARKGKVC